jgi:hypothetical protein
VPVEHAAVRSERDDGVIERAPAEYPVALMDAAYHGDLVLFGRRAQRLEVVLREVYRVLHQRVVQPFR